MDTIRQSKHYMTVGLMLGLFVTGSAGISGPSSVLDPYATIQAPTGRASKQMIPESNAVQTSTTYVNVDGDTSMPIKIKKHFSKPGSTIKPEKQVVAKTKVQKIKTAKADTQKLQSKKALTVPAKTESDIVSGTKSAGSKIVEESKSFGNGVASGTKKVGSGITSGAKASGSFLLKGAKVIGGGFRGADDKKPEAPGSEKKSKSKGTKISDENKSRSDDAKLTSDNKKNDLDEADKKEKKVSVRKVLSPISNTFKGTVSEIKDGLHAATDTLSITKPKPGKDSATAEVAKEGERNRHKKSDLEPTYVANGKPVKHAKQSTHTSNGPGLVSKALGKMPFIGGKKKSGELDTGLARKSDPDALLTEPVESSPRRTAVKSTALGDSL